MARLGRAYPDQAIILKNTVTTTNIYNVSVTESGTAADTVSDLAALPSTISESGAAADTVSSLVSTNDAVSESGSAADTVSDVATLPSTVSESGSAVDTVSQTGPSTYPVTIAEVASAVDTLDTDHPGQSTPNLGGKVYTRKKPLRPSEQRKLSIHEFLAKRGPDGRVKTDDLETLIREGLPQEQRPLLNKVQLERRAKRAAIEAEQEDEREAEMLLLSD